LTNFSKNSFYLLPEPLRLGEFLTNYCYCKDRNYLLFTMRKIKKLTLLWILRKSLYLCQRIKIVTITK